MHSIAHRMPTLAKHSHLSNTRTHWTPALIKHSHSLNTHAHRTLTRPDAYAPLAAITPFCTSLDLSHYFWTPCISLFTVYIRPCQQRDPYPFLFGSPARYVCTVRATAVGRDVERNAVLAGDPKVFRLLCNINLNKNIPSRGSKEERIRILLRVWANIQETDILPFA